MNPGSPEALAGGCQCPEEPNQGGQGTFSSQSTTTCFVVQEDCPMHGRPTWANPQPQGAPA